MLVLFGFNLLTRSQLFRYFDWAIGDPSKPWDTFNTLGIFVINDMWVQVTAR
jgi:hypothetical protein